MASKGILALIRVISDYGYLIYNPIVTKSHQPLSTARLKTLNPYINPYRSLVDPVTEPFKDPFEDPFKGSP